MNHETHIEGRKRLFSIMAMGQLLQLVALLLFWFLLYHQEQGILAAMAGEVNQATRDIVHQQLGKLQFALLPGNAWQFWIPLALAAVSLLFPFRWRWYFLGGAGFGLSFLLLADRVYYDFFSAILSVDSFRVTHQLWAVRHSVLAAVSPFDLVYLFAFVLLGSFGWTCEKWGLRPEHGKRLMFYTEKTLALLLLALAIHAGYLAFYLQSRDIRVDAKTSPGKGNRTGSFFSLENLNQKDYAAHFGLFNFHFSDMRAAIADGWRDKDLPARELRAINYLLKEKKARNDLTSPLWGIARGRDVLLISMESFQYILLHMKLGNREVTPHLNALSEQALSWQYILDNVGRGGTSDAEFMVMTGLLPDARKMASMNHPARNSLLAMPAELRKSGYATYSFHGHDPSYWNRHINHPLYGIDNMFFEESFQFQRLGLGVPDRDFFAQTADYLEEANSPFFAFVISLSSHHPYHAVPDSHRHFETPFKAGSMVDRYLKLANYADQALGAFVEQIKRSGIWDRALIVVYGDHIAPFDSRSRKQVQRQLGFDTKAIREFRVPYLILVPGEEKRIRAHRDRFSTVVGGLQDTFPTILHLLGLDIPLGVYGTHLFVANDDRGPLPYFRMPGAFIDGGLLYRQRGRITDRQGLLFLPRYDVPKLSGDLIQKKALRAAAELEMHTYFFDYDAQSKAIAPETRPNP